MAVEEPRVKLGMFIGVFTPTVLTILGVIMYLRLGWVVGQAGLVGTLAIVVFSTAITLLTTLSLSMLATNMRVGVGGAYYLISRTLGPEVGGAIGIPLFLSQALSVTLYCYGLAELAIAPWPWIPIQPVAAALVVLTAITAGRSTSLALRLQIPMMAAIAASIVSLALGVEWGGSSVPAVGPFEEAAPWTVFAVFFPAVTGILAGVSLSGDLRDPGRAIPFGTLAAVAVGFVVYMTVPIMLAFGTTAEILRDERSLPWLEIAIVPALVFPGMVGAIASSALGSILGAPRTLQALAQDRLVPSALGRTDPGSGEPMVAFRVTAGVALAASALGDLNVVATVLTMFFLTTYGTLNLVAAIEGLVGDPSFRPRIRVPWWAAGLGAAGCAVAMFAISPGWSIAAIGIEVGLYVYLTRRSLESTWGDVRGGMLLSGIRSALLRLNDVGFDPRSWRPHMLVFTTDLTRDLSTVVLADQFSQHRGIVSVVTLVSGDVEVRRGDRAMRRQHVEVLAENGIRAFPEVIAVDDLWTGMLTVAQANGFAGLDSNTILLRWPGAEARTLADLLALTRRLTVLEKCTLIHRPAPARPRLPNGKIVVWWKGKEHNGDLMLLLAHLLVQDREWAGSRVVLRSVVERTDEVAPRLAEFSAMLEEIRIDADADVVVRDPDQSIADVIRAYAQDAAMVFVGMSHVAAGDEETYAERMIELLDGLPEAILVRNGGPFRGLLV